MKRVICYGLMVILGFVTQAQDNNTGEPTFLPPNAAAFSKYGDIPVSHHTGVANISIPIFTITEGNLSLPISMSYHSGGIRVDEMASWVGLGWSLNAGGVISRSVQGGLDEGNFKPHAVSTRAGWGWYRDKGAPPEITNYQTACPDQYFDPVTDSLTTPKINNQNPVASSTPSCYDYHYDAARGLIDTEPDIYSFNIGGYSGKFFFDELQNPVLMPIQDIEIDVTYHATNKKFDRWKVTTPDGTKYYFGKNPNGNNAIEDSFSNGQGSPSNSHVFYSTSSWYLYRIESANNRHWIELEYQPEIYSFNSRASHSCQKDVGGEIAGTDCDQASLVTVRNLVEGVRLSKITTSSVRYEARFLISSNSDDKRQDLSTEAGPITSYPLDAIEIDDNYGWCKKFKFTTSYFQSPATLHSGVSYEESDRKRLKLNAIQEMDCAGNITLPAHIFDYNESQTMGRRYSLGRDHWGYYNGADTQAGLIPNETVNITNWTFIPENESQYVPSGSVSPIYSSGGANRNPSEIKMKAWSLEKITYPTGGYSTFTYEGNRHNGALIGGLRIKKIESFDENNTLATSKSFEYLSSQLYTKADEYGINLEIDNPYVHNFLMGRSFGALFNSTPNTALRHSQNYHIGYTTVKVNYLDGSSQKHVYTNSPVFSIYNYYPTKPTELKLSNGSLIRTESLDDLGNEVARSEIQYDPQGGTSAFTINRISAVTGIFTTTGGNNGPVFIPETWNFKNVYQISSTSLRQQTVTETRDGISQTTNYTYGTLHQQPIEVSTTNSQGEVEKTTTKYAPDLTSTMANNLKSRNQIVPLEQEQYVDSQLISKSNTFFTGNTSVMNLSHIESYPTGTEMIRTDVSFNTDDQFESVQKENDIPVTYFWEGDMGVSVAKFSNAAPGEVFYTSFEELGSGTFSTTLSKTGFYYRSGNTVNLSSLGAPSPSSNLMLSYHYYANGAWQYKEVDYNSSTFVESGATRIDEIRIYPKGALVESFQTGFGGQMISQTDNQGNTIRYVLDSLGRLQYVKDQDNYTLKEYSYNYGN
ncbi:MAG: hypothetical protein R8G66_33845 [Cytophagales bacterium]|nr:hypothetical protein [Cytophagales bacterium]